MDARHRRHYSSTSQEGLSLISVIVAFTLLAVVIGPAALLLEQTAMVSAQTRSRIVAANVAQSTLEILRAQTTYSFASVINTKLGTSQSVQTVGGIPYAIDTTLYWTPGGYAPGGCGATTNGSATLQPLLSATVAVTWPALGSQPPVTLTSAFHPPAGAFSPLDGAALVDVVGSSGTGQVGVGVTVTGPSPVATVNTSTVTDSSGCALVPFLPAGTYQVTLSPPTGSLYVDPSGNTAPTSTVGVTVGTTTSTQLQYDSAASIVLVNPPPPSGSGVAPVVPWSLGVALGSTALPGDETRYFTLSAPSTLSDIYPAATGYALYLGTCIPYTAYPGTNAPTPVTVAPGATATTTPLGTPVTITVVQGGNPVSGATVSLTQTNTNGTPLIDCVAAPNASDIATTDANGQATILAPFGYVTLTIQDGATSVTYPGASVALATGSGVPIAVTITL
ncbi:MAG: hypothetical protein ACYDHP_06395 [Ferrimicrobium sp.]